MLEDGLYWFDDKAVILRHQGAWFEPWSGHLIPGDDVDEAMILSRAEPPRKEHNYASD